MYLRKVIYQMQWQIESLIPSFHLSQRRNLALMVVGMVYAKSVNLPQIAKLRETWQDANRSPCDNALSEF